MIDDGAALDLGPYYDESSVLEWLGIDAEHLASLVADRDILGLILADGDGTRVYPAWQWTEAKQPVPSLADVLTILARGIEDPWTWAAWLTAPQDDLGGLTSVQWLAAGRDTRPVIVEASRDAERWRR